MTDIFEQLMKIAEACGNDADLRIYENGSGELYADGQQLFRFNNKADFENKLASAVRGLE